MRETHKHGTNFEDNWYYIILNYHMSDGQRTVVTSTQRGRHGRFWGSGTLGLVYGACGAGCNNVGVMEK